MRGVGPAQHAIARMLILVANRPAQRIKMRELPRKQQRRAEPAASRALSEQQLAPGALVRALSRGRRPAHQRRDTADQRADPRVDDRDSLERRVDAGVQPDVHRAQEGGRGVDAVVERRDADGAAGEGEDEGTSWADQLSD